MTSFHSCFGPSPLVPAHIPTLFEGKHIPFYRSGRPSLSLAFMPWTPSRRQPPIDPSVSLVLCHLILFTSPLNLLLYLASILHLVSLTSRQSRRHLVDLTFRQSYISSILHFVNLASRIWRYNSFALCTPHCICEPPQNYVPTCLSRPQGPRCNIPGV